MEPFLKQIAAFLYHLHGDNLNRISVIFPGRRSGAFFNAYLNELVEKPVLGPEVITINELISQMSDMQISDQISLILLLHKIYMQETGHREVFDEFYFWGEILLNDFNDLDKYLIDVHDLFRNISDLKEIESLFDYLTPGQKHAIEMFWGNVGKAGNSVNRENFLNIWNKLAVIYNRYRQELLRNKMGYSGLIYRDLIGKIAGNPDFSLLAEHYYFVGFNALNTCENKLFHWFKSSGRGDFFWDFDERFLRDPSHEAGLFIRKNLVEFPPPAGFNLDEGHIIKPRIKVVSVPGQVAQAQVVNQKQFLSDDGNRTSFDNAALVLADEGLLIPIVSVAGGRFRNINITMGYPLKDTPVFGLIDLLIGLQKSYRKMDGEDMFYHGPVLAILNHQLLAGEESRMLVQEIYRQNKIYVRATDLKNSKLNKLIFSRQENWRSAADYFMAIIRTLAIRIQGAEEEPVRLESEFLYQTYLVLQRLTGILEGYEKEHISLALFYRFFIQHLQHVSVPFEGEPLSGLQVMGVLETRTLDFKKLVIFSVNEGKFPKSVPAHSFIPYNLRKAFGLPAREEQDAIYAYYFYRLIHRADEITLVYDSSSDGLNTGEMSRYLFQIQYDSDFKPEFFHLNFDFKASAPQPISIEGNKQHLLKLLDQYSENKLSPSALNTYLDCKLKFYFRHVARIKETDELKEDIDPRLFGNLFHHAAEIIYSIFKGGAQVTNADLKAAAANVNLIGGAIHKAFALEYYKDKELKDVKISGKNILIAENLMTYLVKMLQNDMAFTPFTIVDLEGSYEADFSIDADENGPKIRLGGVVDRIDLTRTGIRIIDYKTGRNLNLKFRDFSEFYEHGKKNRPKEIFQTLVYSEIYTRCKGEQPIFPSIYKIDEFFGDEFHPEVRRNGSKIDYQDIAGEFRKSLHLLLEEIFSGHDQYEQTTDIDKCRTCPYNQICRRN